MAKFFEAIGYVASVLAAALGIVWLFNKLAEREIEEELEAEAEDLDLDEDEMDGEDADAEAAGEVAE